MTYYNIAKAEIGELTFVDTPHEDVALEDLREAQKDESNPMLVLYRIGPGEGDYEPTHILIDEVIYRLVEVVEIDPVELSKALEGYSIPSGLESHIHTFLRDHKFLLELLFRIREQLPVYFPGGQYQLDLSDDVLVITVVAGADCQEQLTAFDNGWWINNVHYAEGNIIIDAEEA